MLATLLESKSQHQRSAGQILASVAAHTALIGAALYATASGRPRAAASARASDSWVVYRSSAPKAPASGSTSPNNAPKLSDKSWSTAISNIAIHLPSMESPILAFDPDAIAGTTIADLPRGNGVRPELPVYTGEAMRAGQVEKEASLAPGNAPPRYPEALRASGVEGQVVAAFIISADGRYEEGSLRFVRSGNPLFEGAVRTALPRMRFVPAEIGGRKVRQLVEMPFVFTLER